MKVTLSYSIHIVFLPSLFPDHSIAWRCGRGAPLTLLVGTAWVPYDFARDGVGALCLREPLVGRRVDFRRVGHPCGAATDAILKRNAVPVPLWCKLGAPSN